MFNQLIIRQNNSFQYNIDRLNRYVEKYPNIKTFIELTLADNKNYTKWEDYVPGQLQSFMHDLGYNIHGINNEINFNLDWSSTLCGFIGNYFLDDAYFNLKKENKTWKVYPDFDNGIQDPLILINAAYDNAKYYWELDKRLR